VGLDGHVGGGVGDAGEHEAVAHLIIVKERLVRLVDGTSLQHHGGGGEGKGFSAWIKEGVGRKAL